MNFFGLGRGVAWSVKRGLLVLTAIIFSAPARMLMSLEEF